jgi:hypothetical protein
MSILQTAQNSIPTRVDTQHQAVYILLTNPIRKRSGGADRDRTGDPLVANQVLSQLSYSPTTALSKLQRFEVSAAKP